MTTGLLPRPLPPALLAPPCPQSQATPAIPPRIQWQPQKAQRQVYPAMVGCEATDAGLLPEEFEVVKKWNEKMYEVV